MNADGDHLAALREPAVAPPAASPDAASVGAPSPADANADAIIRRRLEIHRKPPPAKFAAIDIGTNSVHLMMVEISPAGDFHILGRDKDMIQLGKGGFVNHVLTPRAMQDGLAALTRFTKMARLKGVQSLKAVATSAVREAVNGGDFVSQVRDQIGLDVHVLSAEEEARLIYTAVRHAVDLGAVDNLIVDIGGGSVELVAGNAARAEFVFSVKLGALRLAELFLHSDPPTMGQLQSMRHHIEELIRPLKQRVGPRRFARCIGTSGTIQNLAAVCAFQRGAAEVEPTTVLRITRAELKALLSLLAGMTRDQRAKIPGIDARRVDMILPATVVLLRVARIFEVDAFEYCDMALREGIIIDHISKSRAHLLARATWPDPRTRSVVQLAERCGYRREHAEQVARLALSLFDQMAPLHGLEARYRELLRFACLLHDIGYLISHQGHHKHSYYLIRNGGLQGFSNEEIEAIANIARYHRKGRPRKSHFSWQQLESSQRPAVRKLIALLRIANALDRTHYSVVQSVTCSMAPGLVRLMVHAGKDAELELWTARRIEPIFRKEFGLELDVTLAEGHPLESAHAG